MARLPRRDRDLALLALSARGDWALERLATLGDIEEASMSVPVGLLASGTLMQGRLGRSEDLAAHIDATLQRSLAHDPEDEGQGVVVRAFRKALQETSFEKDVRKRRDEDRAVSEAIDENPSEESWDEEFERRVLGAYGARTYVTLNEARIWVGIRWQDIGIARVALRHVSAWWLLEAGEEAEE